MLKVFTSLSADRKQLTTKGGEMTKYRVKRPKDTVEVLILPNKDGSGYQYVNLTKGHICPCKFKTEIDALRDMDKKVSEDKVLYYEEIKDSEVGK